MLADHLAWIVAQDWVGDFYDEIRRVWSLLVGANGGDGTARIPRPRRARPECGGVTITRVVGILEATCGAASGVWPGLAAAQLGSAA
jgi:hypothetical protein